MMAEVVAKKTKSPSQPSTLDMITKAITSRNEAKGSSVAGIKSTLKSMGFDVSKKNIFVNSALKRGVATGVLNQVKGVGATGTFKLDTVATKAAEKEKAQKEKERARKAVKLQKENEKKSAAREKVKAKKAADVAKKVSLKKKNITEKSKKSTKPKTKKTIKTPTKKATTKKAVKPKTTVKPKKSTKAKKPVAKK